MQTSWLSKKHSSTAYVFQMRESTAKSIQHRQKHALMSADEQHNKQPTPCNSRRESAKEQKNRTALRKSSSAWYLREQQGEVSLADVWDQSSPRGRGDARLKWRGRTRGRNEASLPRQYAIWMFSEMRQELAILVTKTSGQVDMKVSTSRKDRSCQTRAPAVSSKANITPASAWETAYM